MAKATVKELVSLVKSEKARSHWSKAVQEDALELLENFIQWHGSDAEFSKENISELLNGARDWKEYSYGGCALCYDEDIAKHYCTPSELKRVKNGERQPNSRQSWLDVQARALRNAKNLIERAVWRAENAI